MFVANFNELKRIPLAEFCIDQLGYKIRKGSDSRRWRALDAPNGELIITRGTPNAEGYYSYFEGNRAHKGTVIDLLTNVHGMSLPEIREQFCQGRPTALPFVKKRVELIPPLYTADEAEALVKKEVVKSPFAFQVDSFLTWRRGLKKEVLELFAVRGGKSFALFPLVEVVERRLAARTAIFYELRPDQSTRPRFLKGPERLGSFCLLVPKGLDVWQASSAIIFESPIDALACYQLRPSPALYVATCGRVSRLLLERLPRQLNALGVQHVFFSMDEDEAGLRMERELWVAFGGSAEAFKEKWGVELYPSAETAVPVACQTQQTQGTAWEATIVAGTKKPEKSFHPEWN